MHYMVHTPLGLLHAPRGTLLAGPVTATQDARCTMSACGLLVVSSEQLLNIFNLNPASFKPTVPRMAHPVSNI